MNGLDTTMERQQLWNDTLERLGAASEALADRLEQAGEQFPNLVGAFNLLVAYIGHLHQIIERSPGINLQVYPLPERFCARNPLICKCAHGDWNACKLWAGPKF